jgi:hypothetical protein
VVSAKFFTFKQKSTMLGKIGAKPTMNSTGASQSGRPAPVGAVLCEYPRAHWRCDATSRRSAATVFSATVSARHSQCPPQCEPQCARTEGVARVGERLQHVDEEDRRVRRCEQQQCCERLTTHQTRSALLLRRLTVVRCALCAKRLRRAVSGEVNVTLQRDWVTIATVATVHCLALSTDRQHSRAFSQLQLCA